MNNTYTVIDIDISLYTVIDIDISLYTVIDIDIQGYITTKHPHLRPCLQ